MVKESLFMFHASLMRLHVSVPYFSVSNISVSRSPQFSPVQNPCPSVWLDFRFQPSSLSAKPMSWPLLCCSCSHLLSSPFASHQLPISLFPATPGQLGQQMVKDLHLSASGSIRVHQCSSVVKFPPICFVTHSTNP